MLNRAARYFPISEELRSYLHRDQKILEIGSGSIGIGEFTRCPFVGCDIAFDTEPRKPMLPIISSAMQLPFPDGSFDVVIASDVMEHVPPQHRGALIAEALRVTRKKALFGFPCGARAFAVDQELAAEYSRRTGSVPVWLEEHMRHQFPEHDLFDSVPEGWVVVTRANENLKFHYWIMKKELSRFWRAIFRVALSVAPALMRKILGRFDAEPSYRKIFVLTRKGQPT